MNRHASIAALLLGMLPCAAFAQRAVKFNPASKIVIEGSSNVHKWTCATSTFEISVDVPDSPPTEIGKALKAMDVSIPVKSLDCGHGDMNKNLQKAMNVDKYPTIHYRLVSYETEPKAGSFESVLKGLLTINGKDRETTVRATVTPNGGGGFNAIGSTSLKTTDFGVKPVSALLGTLRSRADVTITFRLVAPRI